MEDAALRFVEHTEERVAIVCAKDAAVAWSSATKDFGSRPRRRSRVGEWTEAHDFFAKGRVAARPQTVSASAWIDDADDDADLVEHVFAIPRLNMTMSLLWWKP